MINHLVVKKVISGPHQGRIGNVVSIPWVGNLWNLRMTLNVPESPTREWIKGVKEPPAREWIKVWSWQTECGS